MVLRKIFLNITITLAALFVMFGFFQFAQAQAQAVTVGEDCTISGSWYALGQNEPSTFFTNLNNPPLFYLNMSTEGCQDEGLYLEVEEIGGGFFSEIDSQLSTGGIPSAEWPGNFSLRFQAGVKQCDNDSDDPDCIIKFRVWQLAVENDGTPYEEVIFSSNGHHLMYECPPGSGCGSSSEILFLGIFDVFETSEVDPQNLAPLPVIASEYEALAPLPGYTSTVPSFGEYLAIVFNILLILAGVLSFLMIVIGGFQYMAVDSITGKAGGKERIKNAILGLLIALGAWIILNTINPDLINLGFNVKQVQLNVDGNIYNDQGDVVGENLAGNLKVDDCIDCTDIDPNITTKNGKQVSQNLAAKLIVLNQKLAAKNITGWRVTEAMPRTQHHSNTCHYNGTCIDANFNPVPDPKTHGLPEPTYIRSFIDAAQEAGLRAQYEVGTTTQKDYLTAEGFSAGRGNDFLKVNGITAPHFSVYCDSCSL
jgi:hypothetical protein